MTDSDLASRYRLNHVTADNLTAVRGVPLEAEEAYQYHRSLPVYAPTPVRGLPALARELGLAALWVKDESTRFGLNAFKVLGASYAVHRVCGTGCLQPVGERHGLQATRATTPFTLTTATDGNHGRAVAWCARTLGHAAVVFVPRGTVAARIRAIEGEGARVVVVDGDYDQAVRSAADAAREQGWVLVQDTAWRDYTTIPAWIMAGYVTILRELEESLLPAEAPLVDVVVLQAGVGSWAAAAAWHLCRRYGTRRPRIACVEPTAADGLLASAAAGRRTSSRGSGRTIMVGLNCATPSSLAWPIIEHAVDAFLAVPDEYAREAVRRLYRPVGGDPRIVAGESGAAGLAGLLAIMPEAGHATLRTHLGLGPSCRVLLVNTEGDTDPDSFRAICGAACANPGEKPRE